MQRAAAMQRAALMKSATALKGEAGLAFALIILAVVVTTSLLFAVR